MTSDLTLTSVLPLSTKAKRGFRSWQQQPKDIMFPLCHTPCKFTEKQSLYWHCSLLLFHFRHLGTAHILCLTLSTIVEAVQIPASPPFQAIIRKEHKVRATVPSFVPIIVLSVCSLGVFVLKSTDVSENECEETVEPCGPYAQCFYEKGNISCRCHVGFNHTDGKVNFTPFDGQCIGELVCQSVCVCVNMCLWWMVMCPFLVQLESVLTVFPVLLSDINECIGNKEICGFNAYCSNRIGNFSCVCQSGYTNTSGSRGNCTGELRTCLGCFIFKGRIHPKIKLKNMRAFISHFLSMPIKRNKKEVWVFLLVSILVDIGETQKTGQWWDGASCLLKVQCYLFDEVTHSRSFLLVGRLVFHIRQ